MDRWGGEREAANASFALANNDRSDFLRGRCWEPSTGPRFPAYQQGGMEFYAQLADRQDALAVGFRPDAPKECS